MALSSGSRLGFYELLSPLGAGGMGEVYRAKDLKLGREVAIKILPDAFASDPDRLARFQREAQVLASLNHPNIAAIYGLEESEGTKALILELVPGDTLADRIARGPILLDEALPIAKQIAEALEAAHERGIIHRDLKPANIKITSDDVVKVLDFGLAKLAAPAAVISPLSMSPTITSPAPMTGVGMLLGTAAYMSPEQVKGREADKRSDVWGFGCVLYEMLTGTRAFEGENVADTLASVLKSDPHWAALPAVPTLVRFCLEHALVKEPRQRLRDFGDVRLALTATGSAGVVTSDVRARSRWHLPAAAIAAAALAAAVTFWWRPATDPPRVVRFQINAPAGSIIPPGLVGISPDGRTLAYVVERDGHSLIHLRDIDAEESRPLPGTDDVVNPFWSPDGKSLAFVTRTSRSLKRIDIAGGAARTIVPSVIGPWHGSWGSAGDILFASVAGATRVSADGGETTPAVRLKTDAGEFGSAFPVFLPDGKRFLVQVNTPGGSEIQLASLGSDERKALLKSTVSSALIAPTPAGRTFVLFMRDEALVAQEFDPAAGELGGTPHLVVNAIGRVANPAVRPTVGVSPAGVIAYQHGGDFAAIARTWMTRTGKTLSELALAIPGRNAALSPDDRFLAMDAQTTAGRELWIADLSRGVTTKLTAGADGAAASSPTWSADGRRIAFSRSGRITIVAADGGGPEQTVGTLEGRPRSWSADGRLLLFERTGKVFVADLMTGAEPVLVSPGRGIAEDGYLSPDAKLIAYVSDESGRSEVYVRAMPPANGRLQLSPAGGFSPRWSRSGELFYLGADHYLYVVKVNTADLSVGTPQKLFDMATFGNTNYVVSGDGQRFLVPRQVNQSLNTPITVVLNWWVGLPGNN